MISGRARLIGDNISTPDIVNDAHLIKHMATGAAFTELVPYLFATCKPDLGSTLQKGDIIVAGENFGFGSSHEAVPLTLKAAGIPCIIARSFARTFYRAGINLGILPIECKVDAKELDTLEIDPEAGKLIVNHDRVYTFHQFSPLILSIIHEKGLLNYCKTHGIL
jgi:3-isopropylmalate dehydratase small subunit